MLRKLLRIRLAAAALAMPVCGSIATADCPCQQGQSLAADVYAPAESYADGTVYPNDPYAAGAQPYGTSGTPSAAPYGAAGGQSGAPYGAYGAGGAPSPVPYRAGAAAGMPASTPGTPLTPPPGTLGQTYQLRSDPVPADKHPRAGMIVVSAPGATDVLVQEVNNFRTRDTLKGFEDAEHRGTWHFESIMLLPGQTNIHRVQAIYPAEDGTEGSRVEVRYVRFIMGRVVYLDI